MHHLNRYLLRQAASTLLLTTVCLTLIVLLTQVLRLVDLVVNRGAPLSTFLALAGYMLPGFVQLVLPLALGAAVIWLVQRLLSDAEWPVLLAAGRSPMQIAQPLLWLALSATLISYALALWIVPQSYQAFKNLESSIRADVGAAFIEEGVFQKLGDTMTIFASRRETNGELTGLLLYDRRNPERPATILAEKAQVVQDNTGRTLLLVRNGSRQEEDGDTGHIQFLYFTQYAVDLDAVGGAGESGRGLEIEELSLQTLLGMSSNLQAASPQQAAKWRAAGHARLTRPLLPMTITLVVLAILCRAHYNRRGMSRTVAGAVVSVLGVELGSVFAESMAAKVSLFVVLQYLAVLVPGAFAAAILSEKPCALRPVFLKSEAPYAA